MLIDTARSAWLKAKPFLLILAIVLMALASAHRLKNEFSRLLFDPTYLGAIDLKIRHAEVQRWFSGQSVYSDVAAIYPPATYLFLWPFLGWLTVEGARWLWALTSICAAVWLIYFLIQESGADQKLERIFIALWVPATYSVAATIGNGQLNLHLFPPMLAALLLIDQKSRLLRDLLVAALMIFALMKPLNAVPFLWILLFAAGRLRPVVLTGLGYLLFTFVASLFQPAGMFTLIYDWLSTSTSTVIRVHGGYANLHSWLIYAGLEEWILPASVFVFIALGVWLYLNRGKDRWLLIGVTAIVCRFWMYHLLYDDMLILLAMIALFRLAHRDFDFAAGVLLFIVWMGMMAPARLLVLAPPWGPLFGNMQAVIWALALLFFLLRTRRTAGVAHE